MVLGYQDIGDGLLILLKNNFRNQEQKVGPGFYQHINYFYSKKNPVVYSIKKSSKFQQNSNQAIPNNHHFTIDLKANNGTENITNCNQLESFQETAEKSKDLNQYKASSSIDDNLLAQKISKSGSKSNKVIHNRNTLPIKAGIEKIKESEEQSRDKQEIETNLEQLMLREKLLGKVNSPGPGQYNISQNQSTFNSSQKKKKSSQQSANQESQSNRLNLGSNSKCPGPGSYTVNIERSRVGPKFGKEDRINEQISSSKKNEIPGVGTYSQEVIVKHDSQQIHLEYPSVFGSGSQRFMLQKIEESPGPADYSSHLKIPEINQRKRKQRFQSHHQSNQIESRNLAASEQQIHCRNNSMLAKYSQQLPQSNIFEQNIVSTSLSKPDYQKKLNDLSSQQYQYQQQSQSQSQQQQSNRLERIRGSSCFESDSQRFYNKYSFFDVGPGQYQNASQIIRPTFNVGNNLFSKEKRKIHSIKVSKNIGPGTYDANKNLIKPKILITYIK